MNTDPTVRTIFQFRCSDCNREEFVRFPFNVLTPTPDLIQCVPEGWTLVLDGDSLQTPLAFCGCTAGQMGLMN